VLDLVLERGDLSHDLLALLPLLGIVAVGHGAEGIVNRLCLERKCQWDPRLSDGKPAQKHSR
jgi:hypothetical protein